MSTYVAVYHLRVKEKHEKSWETLDSIGGTADFLDFVENTLETCKTDHHNDIAAERIALTDRVLRKGRTIEGRIEVGDYGRASNVRNAADAKTVFKKTKKHADALPIFFRLEIPENRDEALLIIEKSRKTSAKTAFVGMLRYHFEATFDEYSLSVAPVLPDSVFAEHIEKGRVTKISFIKMGIPSDITDLLDKGHEELLGKTEFVVTAPRNRFLPVKRSILNSADPIKRIQDLYELRDLEYDNIRVEVVVGKNRRSIDLGRKFSSPLYDLSSEVKTGPDGNPTYESMSEAFANLAIDVERGAYAAT